MEKRSSFQKLGREIRGGKRIVGAGVVQQDPVNAGGCQSHRIGRGLLLLANQPAFRVPFRKIRIDDISKGIAAKLSHQSRVYVKQLQGKPGVCHHTAGIYRRFPHAEQLAGAEQLADFRNLFPTQRQCDVHTHMARYYNLFLHSYNTTGYSVQSRNSAGVSSSTSGNLPVSSKNRLSLESSLHWETSMTMVFPPSAQKL